LCFLLDFGLAPSLHFDRSASAGPAKKLSSNPIWRILLTGWEGKYIRAFLLFRSRHRLFPLPREVRWKTHFRPVFPNDYFPQLAGYRHAQSCFGTRLVISSLSRRPRACAVHSQTVVQP